MAQALKNISLPIVLSLFSSKRGDKILKPSSMNGGKMSAELDFNDEFGVPMVNVSVNGETSRFIFDTGASILCVTDRLAASAGLIVRQSRYRFKNLHEKLKTACVDELTLGSITIRNEDAVVLDSGNTIFRILGVDGIIGGSVLEHFTVSFDTRRRKITITDDPANLLVTHNQWQRFRLWRKLPLMRIGLRDAEGRINEVRALFDSGNGTGAVVIPTIKEFEWYIKKGAVSDIEEGKGMTSRMISGIGSAARLYRGHIGSLYMAGVAAENIPVMSGGLAYPLLCWKLSTMGVITIDYPRRRYGFIPYPDARAWEMIRYPVMTTVEKRRLIVASVWETQLRRIISPGDIITAIGGTPVRNPSETGTPNIDELIPRFVTDENQTVTLMDSCGVSHILPSRLFILNLL